MSTNSYLPNSTLPSRKDVSEDVRRIVAEYTTMPLEQIEERHSLFNDLGYDSLDVVETTMEVEEQFDISVPDDQGQEIRTVGDIVDGVLRLLGQSGRSVSD